MLRRLFACLILLLALTPLVIAPVALADGEATCDASATQGDPFFCACHSSANTSQALGCNKQNGSDTITGPNGILKKAQVIISVIAGIAAVILVFISGFKFVTSNGDSQKVASARTTLIYTLIGIGVIVLADAIISFVIRGVK